MSAALSLRAGTCRRLPLVLERQRTDRHGHQRRRAAREQDEQAVPRVRGLRQRERAPPRRFTRRGRDRVPTCHDVDAGNPSGDGRPPPRRAIYEACASLFVCRGPSTSAAVAAMPVAALPAASSHTRAWADWSTASALETNVAGSHARTAALDDGREVEPETAEISRSVERVRQ